MSKKSIYKFDWIYTIITYFVKYVYIYRTDKPLCTRLGNR